jgi:hypothetical protein
VAYYRKHRPVSGGTGESHGNLSQVNRCCDPDSNRGPAECCFISLTLDQWSSTWSALTEGGKRKHLMGYVKLKKENIIS